MTSPSPVPPSTTCSSPSPVTQQKKSQPTTKETSHDRDVANATSPSSASSLVGRAGDTVDAPGGAVWALRDSWNEATRHLRAVPRSPELLLFATLQPIMFVLLFNYVFGGAIAVPGYSSYTQYLIPGVFAQTVVFGSAFTGIGIAEDLQKGFIDRLRSLPISQGAVLSGRDRKAANNTVDGLLRLLYPNPEMEVPDDFLEWAATLALEMRRRVKEAQAFIGAAEFGKVDLSYRIGDAADTIVYCDESVRHRLRMESEVDAHPVDSQTADGEVLPAPDPKEVSSNTPARDFTAGDTIGGRFEVEEVLGAGGFSKVYRVRDVVEGVERALKLFDNAAGYDAVRREISALRKVHHPNVVKVIWADRTDHGEWYLIMEYIEGELLADYATGKKQLRDRESVDVALDVLSALVAIHPDSERLDALDLKKREGEITADEYDELMSLSENALVHRDIKPQNIMLTRSGAKLLDFNIASRVGDPVRTVSGTPPYQPPDANLTRWDVSTDLFAVGVTLYELLCDGQHPYLQARPTLDVEPRDPRQFRTDLNAGLAELLLRACAA
ncbi:MAG: protein kinase [Microthrixaceae bacterium]